MTSGTCDRCGKKPAEITFKDVSDGEVHEYHLCPQCAREMGAGEQPSQAGFTVSKLVAGIEDHKTRDHHATGGVLVCPSCGLGYREFKETGQLGCSQCYTSFQREVGLLIRRLHGSLRHGGRGPGEHSAEGSVQLELRALRTHLADVVAEEAYEEAARIRDRIKELKEGGIIPEQGSP